jgi:hypothetical protein
MNETRAKIAAAIVISLAVIIYVAYWYRSLTPVSHFSQQVKNSAKILRQEQSADNMGATEQVALTDKGFPAVDLAEIASPHFVRSVPSHGTDLKLEDINGLRLVFSAPLRAESKVSVFNGKKRVAAGGAVLPDGKTLYMTLPDIAAGANEKALILDVFYDACFSGDDCYKGQFAFIGISK